MTPRVLIIGNSRAGKTLVGEILAERFGTVCVNTGDLIAEEYERTVCPLGADKHANRKSLYVFACNHHITEPAYYVRQALERGSVVAGVRRPVEFAACRAWFDLCVWKDASHLPPAIGDEMSPLHADIEVQWGDEPEDVEDQIEEAVLPFLNTPEVYIIGRYRWWLPDGSWDYNRMDDMADEESNVAGTIRAAGLRAFCPIETHTRLDTFWDSESATRILALCRQKLERMRHRDAICIRDGWKDTPGQPDSEGAWMEIQLALERGLHVLYTQHGDDTLRLACEMLLGRE
jgi:hypothetical protein